MTENSSDFNNSFNMDFCLHLENYLSSAFANSQDEKLNGYWCDGVLHAPYYRDEVNIEYLNSENVVKRGNYIKTTAWIGKDGQGKYNITINLGKDSISKYKRGENLVDCLYSAEKPDWLHIDIKNKTIEIELK